LRVNRIILAAFLMLISIVVGMWGFMSIEHFGWIDAFYMTIITIGSVGFTEVHKLSPEGRVFTSLYIIFNLSVFAFIVSVITRYFFEGELGNLFKEIRKDKKIKKMKNHIIVCGYGRNGNKAVEELMKYHNSIVVIETNPLLFSDKLENQDLVFVTGDASQDEMLIKAGIKNSTAIITTLPSDADNVFIALTARELNPGIKIIARASDVQSESKLKRAGADHVVMPEVIGGFHMASLVTNPDMMHFADLIRGEEDAQLRVKEFTYDQFLENYRNKNIGDLGLKQNNKIIVVAYSSPQQGFIFNPDDNIKLQPDGSVILLGDKENLGTFKKKYISNNSSK
jgi:voltage-gated potassium channel